MKTIRLPALFARLSGAPVAFLYAFGVALPVCRALSLPVSAFFLALQCLLFTSAFSLLSLTRPLRLVRLLLSLLCAGVFIALAAPMLRRWTPVLLTPDRASLSLFLQLHAGLISTALCFVLTRLCLVFSEPDSGAFFAFFVWSLMLLFLLLYFAPSLRAVYLIPLLLALLLSLGIFSFWPTPLHRLLPGAAVCLLAALLIAPASGLIYPPFADFAQRTRQFMEDYFFFTQSRTVYSIHLSGYQPYGHEQLGGPIAPADEPVMEVATPETALLRGVIKNEYTGAYWRDATSANRYLFVNPRFSALRRQLFDLNRPREEIAASSPILTEKALTVHVKKPGASTLFVPARTHALSSEDGIVPYFGPSSEIFATRSLSSGESYTLYAPLFTGATPGLDALVQAAQQDSDPYAADVAALYTAVPESVEDAVRQLAHAITQNAATPFEKAQLICEFLRTRYPYTYDQGIPPAGRDFVSWFLLEEKQGYCVSYASAMAILGRIVGLPTRYIEGYVARPDADGIARVTELNAHAWVEVYFSGFGWVPFDPTAGSVTGEDGDQPLNDAPQSDGSLPGASSTPTPAPQPGEDDTAPQERELPTPQPTQTSSASPPPPTPVPSSNPDGHTPTPPPSVTPTPPPAVTPTPAPDAPPDENPPNPPVGWALFLLFLLLALALALRALWTDPLFRAARLRHPRAQMLLYYRALLLSLACMRLGRERDESPLMHARRVHSALDGVDARDALGLIRAAQLISRMQYSMHNPQSADAEYLKTVYMRLQKRMSLPQRLRFFAARMIHDPCRERAV